MNNITTNIVLFKRVILFLTFLMLFQTVSNRLNAQIFKVDSVTYNGVCTKFINFVFLSDGFKDTELASYISSVKKSGSYIFNVSPFKEYSGYFNIMAIRVPSTESGADHPRTASDCPPEASHPKLTTDTYFNSTFDSNSIHRLLVSSNYAAINNVIINNFPLFDQTVMLVNTSYYGGSGGSPAVASLNTSSNELVMHEGGHSFTNLADEYWAGDVYASERVNMTKETNPALVKWKNWIGVDGVGIYQHGTSGTQALWYRPSEKCKMLALGNDFCPVCREAITLTILQKFGSPVKAFYPSHPNINFSSQSMKFKVDLFKPFPNTLRTKWFLNGFQIALNSDSLLLKSNQLISGINTLSVQLLDTTSFIRNEKHASLNTHSVNWIVNNVYTDSEIITYKTDFMVYPNPVFDEFIIEYPESHKKVIYEIVNSSGQTVRKGKFTEKTTVNSRNFTPGIYLVKLISGDVTSVKKVIKEQ